jgi:ABC-type uncharacterized transport system permease subunit
MLRLCLLGLIAAIAIAWIGAAIHASGHAPLGLVSIAVGVSLGAALVVIAAKLRVASLRGVLISTLVLALIAVVAQHAWLYADFRQQWRDTRENSPQVAMFRDESPWTLQEYFAREATPKRVTLWCADAALIITAAVGTVWVLRRHIEVDSASRPTPQTPTSDL